MDTSGILREVASELLPGVVREVGDLFSELSERANNDSDDIVGAAQPRTGGAVAAWCPQLAACVQIGEASKSASNHFQAAFTLAKLHWL